MSANRPSAGEASEFEPGHGVQQREPAGLQSFERRSATRPIFVPGWRKTIPTARDCSSSAAPTERAEAIRIWIARTETILKSRSTLQLLTDDDWRSLGRLKVPAARHSAITARILLRLGLSHLTNHRVAPREWTFRRTLAGKPMLVDRAGLNFSVTHVDEIAAVAVTAGPSLGIDIESVDQDPSGSLLASFLHPSEQIALHGLSSHQQAREFIRLWTSKEAYTKLVGLGHGLDFAAIDLVGGSIWDGRAPCVGNPVLFESFYASFGHALYHTTLAMDAPVARSTALELQIINVVAPGSSDELSCAPIC